MKSFNNKIFRKFFRINFVFSEQENSDLDEVDNGLKMTEDMDDEDESEDDADEDEDDGALGNISL